MKTKRFRRYWLLACLGVLLASYYPLSMGVRVVTDMLIDGTVMKENYPKYIIPYTPICVAVLLGTLLMPLCMKHLRRFALLVGSAFSTITFFALELLFERKVVVTVTETITVTKLQDWQMYMCYQPAGGWEEQVTGYKALTPVEILMGDYNPAFKLHFYVISLMLILSILNCLYGFAKITLTGDKRRCRALVLQSVASLCFLGLCILACFTAFWRDGNLTVSPLSACLMAVFFILLGMVGGIYTGSFLLERSKHLSVILPAIVASALTALMYAGELILLHGNLYRFGSSPLFAGIPGLVLAPIDLLIIFAAGAFTTLTLWRKN